MLKTCHSNPADVMRNMIIRVLHLTIIVRHVAGM